MSCAHITFVGGPHDGKTKTFPGPSAPPRVLTFQGDFGDGVFRVYDYVRVGPNRYQIVAKAVA